jgi:hypothetical protein
MPIAESRLNLCCHPATPAPTVRAIEARADWRADGALRLSYCLWGDMARIRVPAPQTPGPTDLLWQHTCFEAFIGVPGESAYREFNLSPSGQWAAYAFTDYRQRNEQFTPAGAPQISVQCFAGRLELLATLAPECLPNAPSHLEIGLSAVVEADDIVDGAHSYWALHHPLAQPDFHHRAAFVLSLPAPQTT